MSKLRIVVVFILAAGLVWCLLPGIAFGCAEDPCYWIGSAEVNGVGVPVGTQITAWINGVKYAETVTGPIPENPKQGVSEFRIMVKSDDPETPEIEGGNQKNGDMVVFKIKRAGDSDWLVASIDPAAAAKFVWANAWYDVLLTVETGTTGTLEGQVHLQGREEASGDAWVISLNVTFLQNSIIVKTLDVTTNDTGAFNITGIAPGTYDIRVKNSHTLSNLKQDVVFAAGEATEVDFGTLIEGDATNDNVVDIDDVSLVASCFGKLEGEPGFIDNCDFNRDGVVDIDDITLIIGNFGLAGDIIV